MKLFRWPSLEVHCWGGLGSQLYALALNLRLSELYPRRQIEIVFHTGGVTQRSSDLEFLFPKARVIQDFSTKVYMEKNGAVMLPSSIGTQLRSYLKRALLALGFLASLNNEKDFHSLKPWVIAIRGHYSDLRIAPAVVREIYRIAVQHFPQYADLGSKEFIGIHYRLGDLLELNTKNPTDSNVLKEVIKHLPQEFDGAGIRIFSDSPEVAIDALRFVTEKYTTLIQNGSPWEVVLTLANARILIGTSSKLSIWSSIFALCQNQNVQIFLPSNLEPKFISNLHYFPKKENIRFI